MTGGKLMFRKFLEWIRNVVNSMLKKKGVEDALHLQVALSSEMTDAMSLWCRCYEDKAPWVDGKTVKSLGLVPTMSSEVARLATTEFSLKIDGAERAKYLSQQFVPVIKELRRCCEYAVGKGGLVLKPYISGAKIAVDVVQADRFFPTEYSSSGKITGAVFVEQKTQGKVIYTRLELHSLTAVGVRVVNKAYRSIDGTGLGREISLTAVPEWSDLEPEALLTGTDRPLFSYFKMPFGNNVDPGSPLGVSIAAKAMKLIEEADRQYSRLLWEFEGGELAIDADSSYLRVNPDDSQHFSMPKTAKRLFRGIDASDDFYKVFSPTLRDTSLINGLNQILRRIEFACGLSYGVLSDPSEKAMTATEIVSSKQRLFSTIGDIQNALEDALKDLLYAMDWWANFVESAPPAGKVEITFIRGDSIITDKESEKQLFLQEVRDGIRQKWEYRVKFLGEDEETAKSLVVADPTDDMLMGF